MVSKAKDLLTTLSGWVNAKVQSRPAPPNIESCYDCNQEALNREPWQERHGSIDDWLESFVLLESFEHCTNWWRLMNTIQWSKADRKKLQHTYLKHASKIAGKEHTENVKKNREVRESNPEL